MSVVTLMAQDSLPGRPKRVSKQKSEKIAKARDYDFSDLEMKTIVEEDFSKFTAGSDGKPDRLLPLMRKCILLRSIAL